MYYFVVHVYIWCSFHCVRIIQQWSLVNEARLCVTNHVQLQCTESHETVCGVQADVGDAKQTILVGDLVKDLASMGEQVPAREKRLVDFVNKIRNRETGTATLDSRDGSHWDTPVLSEVDPSSLEGPMKWKQTVAVAMKTVTMLDAQVVSLKQVCLVPSIIHGACGVGFPSYSSNWLHVVV